MKKVSGQIKCEGDHQIPEGAVVTVQVCEIKFEAENPTPISLGEKKIHNAQKFPIDYEVEYDDSFLDAETLQGHYIVRARVDLNGSVGFITETPHSVIDWEKYELLERVDIEVARA